MNAKLKFKTKLSLDSFIYTKSRKSATRNFISVTICIVLSLIVSLLLATIVGYNPFTIITDLFTKGFIDPSTLIWNITVLGVGALAFSFAFRAGIFNIGISGQMLGSGLVLLAITKAIHDTGFTMPSGISQIFALLVVVVAGAFIASITSLLKIYFNVNEVVSSILLNWIIYFAVRLIVYKYFNSDPGGIFSQSVDFPTEFRLVASVLGGLIPCIIIFFLLVALIFGINKYTTFGHKISAVGFSKTAAKYAGYNYKIINISTMAISGALAGVMAYILYTAGQSPSIPISKDYDSLPIQGFNAIAIGLIALNNPIAIIPVSFIMGLFQSSAPFLTVSPSFSQVIMGMVILGAAMFVILLRYKPWLWFMKKFYGPGSDLEYQNYENKMESLISQNILKLSKIQDNNDVMKAMDEYLLDKKAIYKQYQKRLLVFKATKTFYPEINVQTRVEALCKSYDAQLLKQKQRRLHHLSNLKNNNNNLFDNILFAHNNLFNSYDKALLSKKAFNPTKWKLSRNKSFFLYYIAIQYQKYDLFNSTIDISISKFTDFQELIIDLKNIKQENKHRFLGMINSFSEMTNHSFESKFELFNYVNQHFNDFKLIDKLKICQSYWNYQKAFTNSSDKATLRLSPSNLKNEIDKSELSFYLLDDSSLSNLSSKFIDKYTKLVNSYQSNISHISDIQSKYAELDKRDTEQVEQWKDSSINSSKSRLSCIKNRHKGSLEKKYNYYLTKLGKLELPSDDAKTLEKWLSKSYNDAQKTFKKEGE